MTTKPTLKQPDELRKDKVTTIALYALLGAMAVGLIYFIALIFMI